MFRRPLQPEQFQRVDADSQLFADFSAQRVRLKFEVPASVPRRVVEEKGRCGHHSTAGKIPSF